MASVTGRDFFDLVKAIGESKSKQEEDRIIAEEVRNTIFIHQKSYQQYAGNQGQKGQDYCHHNRR